MLSKPRRCAHRLDPACPHRRAEIQALIVGPDDGPIAMAMSCGDLARRASSSSSKPYASYYVPAKHFCSLVDPTHTAAREAYVDADELYECGLREAVLRLRLEEADTPSSVIDEVQVLYTGYMASTFDENSAARESILANRAATGYGGQLETQVRGPPCDGARARPPRAPTARPVARAPRHRRPRTDAWRVRARPVGRPSANT